MNTAQPDLFLQPAPEPRCAACEAPLVLGGSLEMHHIQPAYLCVTPQCSMYGKCLTCQMLVAWFAKVDEAEEPRSSGGPADEL